MDPSADECLLCTAERMTDWLHEDEDCWIAECIVCRTLMVVWRTHGLPEPEREARLIAHLERVAAERAWRRGVLRRPRAPSHPRSLARARAPCRRVLRPEERPLRHVLISDGWTSAPTRRGKRERPTEELIELRHGEGRETVGGRIQQALLDEPRSRLADDGRCPRPRT